MDYMFPELPMMKTYLQVYKCSNNFISFFQLSNHAYKNQNYSC